MTPDAPERQLADLARRDRDQPILDRFSAEPDRMARLTVEAAGLYIDLAKQSWSLEAVDAALDLARVRDLEGARDRMVSGEAINVSEGRAVLHMALRAADGAAYSALGPPVSGEVEATRRAMADYANRIRSESSFDAIVHIGIGGSDLGPRMVWTALKPLQPAIDLRFVSNIDGSDLTEALTGLDPRRTLVVVVSKTFTTLETLTNAEQAKAWLTAGGVTDLEAHLVGVSAAPDKARAFGCGEVFGFADWVGGRYSLWSAVSLSVVVALGPDGFDRLLTGARAMDEHFRTAPLDANAPVLLGLAQVFNVSAGRDVRTVVPYSHRLRLLPSYLQQLEMESNGKSVTAEGRPVAGGTCPAVFGEPGTNAQHAYFQMLHQGTSVVPVEFLIVADNAEAPATQTALNANALAQAEALLVGKTADAARAELIAAGASEDDADTLAPQKAFPGNRPSTTVVLDALTPETLGALIALYEHKTFVEGVIWQINSFDQWGVELGKVLAKSIQPELDGGEARAHDPSTSALIARLRR